MVVSTSWEKYSNRKEYPNITASLDKIQSLSNFNLSLKQKYQLDKDLKKISEKKKREGIALKRCDFLNLIRIKIDESIEIRIKQLWDRKGLQAYILLMKLKFRFLTKNRSLTKIVFGATFLCFDKRQDFKNYWFRKLLSEYGGFENKIVAEN